MAHKFSELEARMSPESIKASDEIYHRLKESMALEELRDALRMTQKELAQTLNVDQSAISKLDDRDRDPHATDASASAHDLWIEIDAVKHFNRLYRRRRLTEYQVSYQRCAKIESLRTITHIRHFSLGGCRSLCTLTRF
jgi:transcriptional regulator with XRE-family HTH domain